MSLIQKGKNLSQISTFGVGGPAKFFAKVTNEEELFSAFSFIQREKVPYLIVGKGSNLLFDDRGFDGLVIHNAINWSSIEQTEVRASGGYSFALLGIQTARKGLSGLEFAAGIPGSVGGAVYMNAGADKKETEESLKRVSFYHFSGERRIYEKKELKFSYRTSSFQQMKGMILWAEFSLKEDPNARKRQIELSNNRKMSQPLWEQSAGCIFRNPKNSSAGKLIEECGLKDFQIGGAAVSPLHANFIVNRNNAKAEDILLLIEHIKNTVKEKKKVSLQTEVRYIPCR